METATKYFAITCFVLSFVGLPVQVSAQDRLEYPQQIRRQPIQAAQPNPVAQSSYQAPIDNNRIDNNYIDNQKRNISGNGFPSLAPSEQSDAKKTDTKGKSFGPLMTTGFSLVVVLGLFAGLVWVTRRYGNGSMTQSGVPSDVLKSLGSTAIDARTQVTMLRCGNRIIVLAQTASGVHPLSEITDPAEVNRLTIACTGDGQASAPTFAETLKQSDPGTGRRLFASA